MSPAQQAAALLTDLGWSRSQVGRIMGVTPVMVTRWVTRARRERGDQTAGPGKEPTRATVAFLDLLAWLNKGHGAVLDEYLGR